MILNTPRLRDEPPVEEEEEEKDHGLLHNYCPTAGDNERRLAAELARDSLCALVPCKEMARGSGALGSCTEEARDSVVALWSAACRDTPRYAEIRRDTPSLQRGFVTTVTRVNNTGSTLRKKKNGRAGMIRICYVYLPCSIFSVVCFYLCHSYLCSFVSCCYLTC